MISDILVQFLALSGGLVIAARVTPGDLPPLCFGIALLAAVVPSLLSKSQPPYRAMLVACLVTLLALAALGTAQPRLLAVGTGSLLNGFVIIAFSRRLRTRVSLGASLRALYDSRFTLMIWLKYRVQTRYAQTVLGILWIIFLPLLTAAVLAFAIGEVLGVKALIGAPYIPFLLSGQVLMTLFSSTILNSRGAILDATPIAAQVYFPREIIILLVIGEAFIDFCVMLAALFVIDAFYGLWPNSAYWFLPIPILLALALTLGVALLMSWLSIVVRDLQQLIAVAVQLLYFLTPVFYASEQVPPQYQILITLNPLAALIGAFRDIILFAKMPAWDMLVYPAVLAGVLLYWGYMVFKANEGRFADFL